MTDRPWCSAFTRLLGGRAVVAIATIAALMALALTSSNSHADVSGISKGHGFTAQGSVLTHSVSLNEVLLPPAGSEGINLNVAAGTVSATADTVIVTCSGNSSGSTVNASCTSVVEGFNLTAGSHLIVGATVLRAQSNSADSSAGSGSNNAGTQIVGLCVVQTLLGPCNPVTGPTTVVVNIPGVAAGTIAVQQESLRSTDSGWTGSGLTVNMLHIDLSIAGQGVTLDVSQADSFVGGVVVSPAGSNSSPPLDSTAPPAGSMPPGGTTPPTGNGPSSPPSGTQPSDGTGITGFPQNLPKTGGRPGTGSEPTWPIPGVLLMMAVTGILVAARKIA